MAAVAIVTGAGGVLGQACVQALLGSDMSVVGVDLSEQAMSSLPDAVHRESADLADPASVDALLDRVTREVGDVDALVHTVGGYAGGDAVETTPDTLRRMLDLNLGAAWWISAAAARRMQQRGRGAIVHVGARNGVDAVAGSAAYSVSKAALIHLTRVLAAELSPHGVRVNVLVPRVIDTPANRASLPASAMARAVAPSAIAAVARFLVGDESAPVTGAVVPVYGTG